MTSQAWLKSGSILAVAIIMAGCSRSPLRRKSLTESSPPSRAAEETAGLSAGDAEVHEASLRHKTFESVPELATIYFDFDRDDLLDNARGALKRNADWLRIHPEVEIQVQGHCDQRGTTEYNLSLGQKRASVVRDFYKSIGIAAGRISTISYGEERLLCQDAREDCWARNRRAETAVRSRTTAMRRMD